MHIAVRSAIDRLIYEQAVTLHILRLAPPGAWRRPVPSRSQDVAELVAGLTEEEEALAAWLCAGMPHAPSAARPPRVAEFPDEALERLQAALRRVFEAAANLPGHLPAAGLEELWRRAALFARERDALLAALPEAADDALVARWKKAPEPPAMPPNADAGADVAALGR